MNLFYKLAYAVGFKPWERASGKETARIAALFDREQADRKPPYGKALDLGCGTGMQAVDLARRGWQVTGVDLVSKALRAARQRAGAAGVDINFVNGDVTALRAAMGREVTAVAAPGATLLMIAWTPGRRPPLPHGASRADIEAAFPGWTIIAEDAIPASALPAPLKNVGPRIYRLRRASGP
jgi:SAM-dependent methyltransferase